MQILSSKCRKDCIDSAHYKNDPPIAVTYSITLFVTDFFKF